MHYLSPFLIYLLIVFLPFQTNAAFEFQPIGARAGGMGNVFAGIASGAEGVFWNPAAVVWGQPRDLFAGFERPFGMQELETQVFGFVLQKGQNGLGVSYQKFGFALYLEQQVGVTFGHLFG
ncbi:MAG: hypothetical protein O7G87_03645, partial [bacterium]|nr:hypothetical protein [bacterium]